MIINVFIILGTETCLDAVLNCIAVFFIIQIDEDLYSLNSWELERKTIEIHHDLKNAKRFCNKEQKVIKVPNTDVFKIVAPLLLSRGISRIINVDQLIAL